MNAVAEINEKGYELTEPVRCFTVADLTNAREPRAKTHKQDRTSVLEAVNNGQMVYVLAADGPGGRVSTEMRVSQELDDDPGFDTKAWLMKDGACSILYAINGDT